MNRVTIEELAENAQLGVVVCSLMAKLQEAKDPKYEELNAQLQEFLRKDTERRTFYSGTIA